MGGAETSSGGNRAAACCWYCVNEGNEGGVSEKIRDREQIPRKRAAEDERGCIY